MAEEKKEQQNDEQRKSVEKPKKKRHRRHRHHHHHQQHYMTTTPDGGWGWIVIFATFLVFFFTLGFKTSLGVFYVHWERYFGVSKTQVSWVTSMSPLIIGIVSPFAAGICHAFGPRPPVIFGGIVAAAGLLGASYAQSIPHLVLCIGIISAIGMGFAFAPSIIVLHHYFEKRFIVANGIAFAGISCGELVFPLVLQPLIHQYGWRGALFLMSAVELNLVACGGVMIRPPLRLPPKQSPKMRRKSNAKAISYLNNDKVHDASNERRKAVVSMTPEKGQYNFGFMDVASIQKDSKHVSFDKLRHKSGQSTITMTSLDSTFSCTSSSSSEIEERPTFRTEPRKSICLFMFGPSENDMENSSDELKWDDDDEDVDNFQNERKPRGQSVISQRSIIERSYSAIQEFTTDKYRLLHPLKHKFFVMILPIMLLHGIGWYAVIAHLIPFAVAYGIPDYLATDLLPFVGVGSLIGCLTHGWFVDHKMVSSSVAKVVSLSALTIITLAYPAAHSSYQVLATLSFFYGIAAGVSLPLFFALIRDLLPHKDVNAGVSLVIMMEMLGDTIGGVSAGLLYDKTHDYEVSFFFAGAAILAATILQIILTVAKMRIAAKQRKAAEESKDVEGANKDAEFADVKKGFKDKAGTKGNPVPRAVELENINKPEIDVTDENAQIETSSKSI